MAKKKDKKEKSVEDILSRLNELLIHHYNIPEQQGELKLKPKGGFIGKACPHYDLFLGSRKLGSIQTDDVFMLSQRNHINQKRKFSKKTFHRLVDELLHDY